MDETSRGVSAAGSRVAGDARAFDRGTGGDTRATSSPPDEVASRRRALRAELKAVVDAIALAQLHGEDRSPREAARLDALSKELAALPGNDADVLSDLTTAQQTGVSDRAEWREKSDAVETLAQPVGDASPEAQRAAGDVERHVEQQTAKLRGTRRPLPPCIDPARRAASAQSFESRAWRDIKALIEELLEYKSVLLTLSVLELEEKPALEYLEVNLDMHWSKEQKGAGDHVEQWWYREATLVIPESPDGQSPDGQSPADEGRLPPGKYRGTILTYGHELVNELRPAEDLRTPGTPAVGRDAASFARVRTRASLVVRLLYQAVGEVDPAFQKTHGAVLRESLGLVQAWRWLPVSDAFVAELPKVPVKRAPKAGPDEPWYTRLPPSVRVATPRVTSISVDVDRLRDKLRRLLRQPPKATFAPRVIHFAHGEDVIREGAARELRQTIEALEKFAEDYGGAFPVEVAGHADKTGDTIFNIDLAKRRAINVATMIDQVLGKKLKSVYPHSCGDRYAPTRNREPEYRVAVVSLDVGEMQ